MGFYIGGKVGPVGYSKSLSRGAALSAPVIGLIATVVITIATDDLGVGLAWGLIILPVGLALAAWIVIPVAIVLMILGTALVTIVGLIVGTIRAQHEKRTARKYRDSVRAARAARKALAEAEV